MKVITEERFVSFYKDILLMNEFVGNKIEDPRLINLYADLTLEEMSEIFDASDDNDIIEFVDGIVDTMVVGSYLYALKNKDNFNDYGVVYDISAIDKQSNLSFLSQTKIYNDALKKASESSLCQSGIDIFYYFNTLVKDVEKIIRYVEEISTSIDPNDIDIFACCDEVSRSNWTKFPKLECVNPDDEVKHIESQGRYTGVTYKIKNLNGDDRVIFYSDKGKFVKPSTFENPNFTNFISSGLTLKDLLGK